MNVFAKIAQVAMWIMIGVIVLSLFMKATWLTVVWIAAAVVCLICILLVAYYKRKDRTRY